MRVAFMRLVGIAVFVLAALLLGACSEDTDPASLFESGDYEESLSRFKQQAAAGDVGAKNYVGVHYYVGAGVQRDFLAAAQWFETAALEGHPGAQKNLGMMYFRGLGVEQNNRRAFGWLHHARLSGNDDAQKYLSQMQTMVTPNASVIAVELISKQLANKEALVNATR